MYVPVGLETKISAVYDVLTSIIIYAAAASVVPDNEIICIYYLLIFFNQESFIVGFPATEQ